MLVALAVLACLPRRAAFYQAPIFLVALVSRSVRALSRCLHAQHAPLSRAVPPMSRALNDGQGRPAATDAGNMG